jgi:hypothetical protein
MYAHGDVAHPGDIDAVLADVRAALYRQLARARILAGDPAPAAGS